MPQSLVKNLVHARVEHKAPPALHSQGDRDRLFAYQDERRALFQQHGIGFDERYVWD